MEKRSQKRARRRLTCEIVVGPNRYPAIVRDISAAGLFVQTRAKPEANSVVEVIFPASGDQPELRLEAGVARQRRVPSGLLASVPEGVGLEVLGSPHGFKELVARLADYRDSREAEDPAEAGTDQSMRTYRVRVTPLEKAGSRVVTVRSETAAGARARALAQVGRGWKIAEVQEI